jgi:hypothetical protein
MLPSLAAHTALSGSEGLIPYLTCLATKTARMPILVPFETGCASASVMLPSFSNGTDS